MFSKAYFVILTFHIVGEELLKHIPEQVNALVSVAFLKQLSQKSCFLSNFTIYMCLYNA